MSAVFGFLCVTLAISIALFRSGMHQIDEGYVGVYYRAGRLLTEISPAGLHFMVPFVTRVEQVQVTLQTDRVQNILCGTTSGVNIVFEQIEVSNRLQAHAVLDVVRNFSVNYDQVLVFQRVSSLMSQMCSRHSLEEMREKFQLVDDMLQEELQSYVDQMAPGLEILAVRISTPTVPDTIARLFLDQEAEKARLKIAVEAQRVTEKKAQTTRLERRMEAESRAEVLRIEQEAKIAERESQRQQSEIEDRRIASQMKSIADAQFYAAERLAAANKLLHTNAYVHLELARAISNNTKVFFGESVSSMFSGLFAEFLQGANKNLPEAKAAAESINKNE